MTSSYPWYVLEFDDGARITAGGGAVSAATFRGPLSTRDGQRRWSLRLWRSPERPDDLDGAARAAARATHLRAYGRADALALDLHDPDGIHAVGRADAAPGPTTVLRMNLGQDVAVEPGEVFDATTAADLFLHFRDTGTTPDGYRLRRRPAPPTARATHVLTVDHTGHRPVLPGAAAEEFTAFLRTGEKPAVLVLWPLPPGRTPDEVTDAERDRPAEFIQTAGSAGRFAVEYRTLTQGAGRLFAVGRSVGELVWDTEPVEITTADGILTVLPHEVLSPAEAGSLFAQWLRTGRIPDTGWLMGEIELPG
jgi:hypothetical protein